MTFVFIRNNFTSSKQCCVFSFAQMFHSYGRAYCTHTTMTCLFQQILHSNAFLILLHGFQSNGSLPCEGSFTHTCTKTFFEECNNHRNSTPTPSIFPETCYYFEGNIAKSDAIPYASTLQNAECCIHSGTL